VPRCKEAIVGHGKAEIEVRIPEQPSFRAEGPMLIYNGAPNAGRPELIYILSVHTPAPTTVFASGVISKTRGRFGSETVVEIPAIHGGEDLLTGFRATIGKTWLYRGRKVNLLSARCPKGRLLAHDESDFIGGYRSTGQIVKQCDSGRSPLFAVSNPLGYQQGVSGTHGTIFSDGRSLFILRFELGRTQFLSAEI
jgi:hypothetical protein